MKYFCHFLFFLFTSNHLLAQMENCGTDQFLGLNKTINPTLILKEQKMNNLLYQAQVNPASTLQRNLYTIPVVFHIIHQNGPENIPDSLLLREMDILNLRFQNAAPYFDAAGSDMEIQFCLASVDPWGNPTTGITRDTSVWTNIVLNNGSVVNQDVMMKNVNRWNPYAYLNVWIVRSVLGSNSPYASLPFSLGMPNDGIVFSYGSVGGNSLVLSHEVGHYLGLYHTFQSYPNCLNFNCLLDGDQVCDTPPDTLGFMCNNNSCGTEMNDTSGFNPFLADVPDFPSYMGACWKAFSPGQKARMHAAITNVRYDLLQSNGCGANPGATPPVASFVHTTLACGLEQFVSTATNAQYTEWDFNSDGSIEATGDSVTWQFPASGTFTVTLRVFNLGGGDSASVTITTWSPPTEDYPLLNISQTNYNATWGEYACYGKTIYASAHFGLSNLLWSTGDTTQFINFVADTSFTLWVQGVDSLGHLWTMCNGGTYLHVTDPLPQPLVYVLSNDTVCVGDTLHFVADLPPGLGMQGWKRDGYFNGTADTNFIYVPSPGNHSIQARAGDANYCQVFSDTVFVFADQVFNSFTPGQNGFTLEGVANWHNQWYRDDVLIPGADSNFYTVTQPGCYAVASWFYYPGCAVMSDSICFLTVGNPHLTWDGSWSIAHNPLNETIQLKSEACIHQNISVRMFDVNGKSVLERDFLNFSGNENLTTEQLSNGVYFLQLQGNQDLLTRKIILFH